MNIINKIRKKIKTIILVTGEYPEEIEITSKDLDELLKVRCKICTANSIENCKNVNDIKFESVKLKIKNGGKK